MPKRPLTDAPQVEVTSRAALRDWLADHHSQPSGVWLVTYKKGPQATCTSRPGTSSGNVCVSAGWTA